MDKETMKNFISKMEQLVEEMKAELNTSAEEKHEDKNVANWNIKIAIANFMLFLSKRATKDTAVSADFVLKNDDMLQRVVSISTTGGHQKTTVICQRSSVQTAIYKQLMRGVDEKLLRRFCLICNSGVCYTSKARSAVNLRKLILGEARKNTKSQYPNSKRSEA